MIIDSERAFFFLEWPTFARFRLMSVAHRAQIVQMHWTNLWSVSLERLDI